jgi:nucleoside phosphorylase
MAPARAAVLAAMPNELRPFVKALSLQKSELDGLPVYIGHAGATEIVAIRTGMGTQLAEAGTERLLDKTKVDRVLMIGIAGGIDPTQDIATLVVPEVVIHGPTGREHRPEPVRDHAPHGGLWTSDEIITDPERVAMMRERGVVALDMETASVADVCERRGVPWTVVRAISDRNADELVDDAVFKLANQDGTPNVGNIARYFARHPLKIPGLIRVGLDAKKAQDASVAAAVRELTT